MATADIPLLRDQRCLFILKSANMNSTSDQLMIPVFSFNNFIIKEILVTNASTSLTTAAGGVYGAASKASPTIVANTQVYSALTTSTKALFLTLDTGGLDQMTTTTVYLSLATAQGSTATADVYVMGYAIT